MIRKNGLIMQFFKVELVLLFLELVVFVDWYRILEIKYSIVLFVQILAVVLLTHLFIKQYAKKFKTVFISMFICVNFVFLYFIFNFVIKDTIFGINLEMLLSFILAVCFTSLLKNKNINIRIGAVFMVFFVMYGALTSTFQYELTQIMLYSIPFLSGIFIGKRYYSQNRNTIFAPLFSLILVLMAFILCFWGADFAACMAIFRFFIVSWLIYTLGIWFFNSKQILTRVFVLILAIALCLSFVMFAEKIFSQKFANGTWTGEVSVPAELSELEFFTDSTLQTKINISDLGKKVYVLDFSNPGCGICFRQMPDFQKLMEKYQDNSEIGFYTIYVYNDTSDIAWFERYTEKRNITIPHLFIDRKDSIYVQVFDYRAFPQYNIIKNNTIIFDGYLNVLKFFHKKYLKN